MPSNRRKDTVLICRVECVQLAATDIEYRPAAAIVGLERAPALWPAGPSGKQGLDWPAGIRALGIIKAQSEAIRSRQSVGFVAVDVVRTVWGTSATGG